MRGWCHVRVTLSTLTHCSAIRSRCNLYKVLRNTSRRILKREHPAVRQHPCSSRTSDCSLLERIEDRALVVRLVEQLNCNDAFIALVIVMELDARIFKPACSFRNAQTFKRAHCVVGAVVFCLRTALRVHPHATRLGGVDLVLDACACRRRDQQPAAANIHAATVQQCLARMCRFLVALRCSRSLMRAKVRGMLWQRWRRRWCSIS